jgi:hypothetical protein
MDRIFKRPFLWPELYRSPGRDVNFLFCLMKNPLLYRSAWGGLGLLPLASRRVEGAKTQVACAWRERVPHASAKARACW